MTSTITAIRTERYDTIVIGAGQSGLATGYHLARRGVDFTIVSDESRIGDNWRRRWDSLRLFTPAIHSSLPGMPFPAPSWHLADKDEVADYLERYAERFDLPVRLETHVESLTHDGTRYRLIVNDAVLEADNVVVATGAFHRPRTPWFAATLDPHIHQLHSSGYHSPFTLPEGPVLVVGAGNSGAQIALELAQHRKVWLAGRDTGHLPRRLLGRDLFAWAWPAINAFTMDSRVGRRLRASQGGDALIGIPERSLREAGVTRVPRVDGVTGGMPSCGGTIIQPRVIVWCTGFEPAWHWIELPILDEAGQPRHHRGISLDAPGLCFVGLRYQHRVSSSLIGGVGTDADWVAAHIAGRLAAVPAD